MLQYLLHQPSADAPALPGDIHQQILQIDDVLPIADTAGKADQPPVRKGTQRIKTAVKGPEQLVIVLQIGCPAGVFIESLDFIQPF